MNERDDHYDNIEIDVTSRLLYWPYCNRIFESDMARLENCCEELPVSPSSSQFTNCQECARRLSCLGKAPSGRLEPELLESKNADTSSSPKVKSPEPMRPLPTLLLVPSGCNQDEVPG
jgi:hypothetical protein